jgi:transcription elongation factor Elf1
MTSENHKEASCCPFCNSADTSLVEIERHRWVVVCNACDASGPVETIPVKAREAWAGVHPSST